MIASSNIPLDSFGILTALFICIFIIYRTQKELFNGIFTSLVCLVLAWWCFVGPQELFHSRALGMICGGMLTPIAVTLVMWFNDRTK